MVVWSSTAAEVAIVAAVRTPFARIGSALARVPVVELARVVFAECLDRGGCEADAVGEVFLGNVAMPADAANPARVAALYAGLSARTPALTVGRNCASGMEAIAQAVNAIACGRSRVVLAGGAESMSQIPLLFPPAASDAFARLMRAKTIGAKLGAIAAFRPRHFKPVLAIEQGLTDPTCGMIMGKTAEVLAGEFQISRQQQDAYALQSHERAIAAAVAGNFEQQIVPIYPGAGKSAITRDIGPREGQSMAALAKLRPYFDKKFGSVTVGNSCQVTDGAAAMLLMHADHAKQTGTPVLGTIRAWSVAALQPQRMGLGPVYAIDTLLRQTGLSLDEMDLVEINEAFAAQVLACVKAMGGAEFCRRELGRERPLGELPMRKLNISGGAIALGHPVGTSGARIAVSLLDDLRRRKLRRGIASLCVGGGQGMAILVEATSP